MRFRMLKKSRKIPKVGDFFVYGFEGRSDYLWGRVVRTDSRIGQLGSGPSEFLLLHFYDVKTESTDSIPELTLDKLLIYPVGTNRKAWLDGFFMTVANLPLADAALLPRYRFRKVARNICVDEYGNDVPYTQCTDEVCGLWGLAGYLAIASAISNKLGFPP